MELKQTLIDISNDARGWLKTWSDGFTDEEARQDGNGVNPLAWQLGHLACSEDDVYLMFNEGERVAPEAIHSVCGFGAPPADASTEFPSLEELWSVLEQTHERFLGMVTGVSDEDLDRKPHKENPYFKTMGQAVYEMALHENYHVGMIGALRKLLGKKPIG